MTTIKTLKALSDNYIYVIEKDGNAAIVDPTDAMPVISFLRENELTPRAILLTHDHSDHTGGISDLQKEYDLEIFGNPGPRFKEVDMPLKGGAICQVIGEPFEVIATPGHTMDHIVYYFRKLGALFSGDTLFGMGCGRLFEGSAKDMFDSFQRLKRLPKETKVYAGHEYTHHNLAFAKTLFKGNEKLLAREKKIQNQSCTMPFTLEEEFETNPFFLAQDVETFKKYRELRDTF